MFSEQRENDTPPRSLAPWFAGGVVLLAAAGLAIVLLVGSRGDRYEAEQAPPGWEHPAVGRQLERLELQPLTGDPPPLSLEDLRGRVTLINFWGPWCGPCVVEFPHLKELEQHFRAEKDFLFVSVSCSQQGRGSDEHMAEGTSSFLNQQKANFPTYRDADGATRREVYRVTEDLAYPTTLVMGRDGTIQAMWVGYSRGVEKQIREVVQRSLAAASTAEDS
jgi:cytochrome c biogenesis protein CcmG, thiol:disulfide interchange protein DsbE